MVKPINRRQFNSVCAFIPLSGVLLEYPQTQPLCKFCLRLGVIVCIGHGCPDKHWKLEFRIAVTRRRSDGTMLHRWMIPSQLFEERLRWNGMPTARAADALIANEVELRHGPAGVALLLEGKFSPEDQKSFYIDPNPSAWGDFIHHPESANAG